MKKNIKIALIIIGILVGIILLDTLQAKVFDNKPIIKIAEYYNGGNLYQKHKGILVDTYVYTDGSQKTFYKWTTRTYSERNEECCKGCMCGDTLELLKTTESAWTLTTLDNNGEYVYDRHSFINFNGTGKKKFAFFKNDDNGNNITEVKGEFIINKKNEILLSPSNNKNNKITCKIGEEKDLIAVIHCDNDFGMFTLQKQGILELPNVIKDTISKTETIIVNDYQNTKTITEEKEINILLTVINNSKVWTGAVTTPSPQYELELFDSNSNRIAKILYNPGHYFNIELKDKNFELTNVDKKSLNTILEN